MKHFNKYNFIMSVVICFLTGCNVYAKDAAPYLVNAEFVMDENSSDYQICGIDIFFMNKSKKKINDFTIVFYLFDSDGEPISEGQSNIVLNINRQVDENQVYSDCISLDKYFNVIPDSYCFIDYLYVSQIIYDDGTIWQDPFGLMCF